jgi:hypothetical protein
MKKPEKRGLYDQDFTNKLTEMSKKAIAEAEAIVKEQYEGLSQSKVFGEVMKKYPSIKETFTERAFKASEAEKKHLPKPRPNTDQNFTL